MSNPDALPVAWSDLMSALFLLAREPSNEHRPFHCEHDVLTVFSDPDRFTAAELAILDGLGFLPGPEPETFSSFRYGSA